MKKDSPEKKPYLLEKVDEANMKYLRKLHKYGIDPREGVDFKKIDDPKTSRGIIDAQADIRENHVKVLVPDSIKDIKKWVGIDDKTVANTKRSAKPIPCPFKSPVSRKDLNEEEGTLFRQALYEYVRGSTENVADWEATLTEAYAKETHIPVFLAEDIYVYDGQVYEVSKFTATLVARHVFIHDNGELALGAAKLDCVTLRSFSSISPVIVEIGPITFRDDMFRQMNWTN